MWYHLSQTEWSVPAITELRIPKKSYGEPRVERFCVSPTLARAFLACPTAKEGVTMFVYQAQVNDPVEPAKVADGVISRERIIDAKVLADHGGKIDVKLVGKVRVESGERVQIRLAIERWALDMTDVEELEVLWECVEGVWRPRSLRQDEAVERLKEFRARTSG